MKCDAKSKTKTKREECTEKGVRNKMRSRTTWEKSEKVKSDLCNMCDR